MMSLQSIKGSNDRVESAGPATNPYSTTGLPVGVRSDVLNNLDACFCLSFTLGSVTIRSNGSPAKSDGGEN